MPLLDARPADPLGVEDGGHGGDRDLDDVVLDDDFVRGATISELGAGERRKQERRASRAARWQRRRRRLRAVVSYRTASIAVGLLAIALLATGLAGSGPLRYLGRARQRPTEHANEDTSGTIAIDQVAGRSTTTTENDHLERLAYQPGDCAFWEEHAARFADARRTKKVSCDEPHVVEMAGHVTLPRTPLAYPGADKLSAVFDSGECKPIDEQYLGAKLDPDGRFYSTGVMPSEESYADGDRDIWCGLARRPDEEQPDQTDPYYLYTGRLQAADQHRVFAVGSCLGGDGDHLSFGTVPCDGPHTVEIAGHVDLGARTGPAPSEDEYPALVSSRCRQLAKAYAGANLRAPVQSGWLWINEASWDSGMRTVMCTVAEYSGQRTLVITRHLAA